ncbi:MAG: hypothetical protein IT164_16730 [Bryobacterales bacterium]|nr:hypothetical protein [Bryobacterales bacterium]
MVETTRAHYIPHSFGDLMEGRLRRVGEADGRASRGTGQTEAAAASDSAEATGGRSRNRSDFQREMSSALTDTPAAGDSAPEASEGKTVARQPAAATVSDGELELRNRLAKAVGAPSENVAVKELAGQNTGRTSGTRQYIVTVDAPGSGGPAEAFGVNHERSLPLAADAEEFNYDAISMVKDRLDKMGIPSSNIDFEYWDDTINNVGGHRTFHYLSADLGNGVKENFSLEWTLYNPDITATEIARLIRGGPGVS